MSYRLQWIALIVLLIVTMVSTPLWSWNKRGHELIGEIAFQNLDDDSKDAALNLLHGMDHIYPARSFAKNNYWADELKQRGVRSFDSWHYINRPYSSDGTKTRPAARQNVLWAIEQSWSVLEAPRANWYEQGLFFRFLLHWVGDAHQPLHCISRYSKTHPRGDLGGNRFRIRHPRADNLHQLWDGAGQQAFKGNVRQAARELQSKYPRSAWREQIAELDPHKWCDEAFAIARDVVYQLPEDSAPSDAYLQKMHTVAEQRLVLAGYRLAAMLNQRLKNTAAAE